MADTEHTFRTDIFMAQQKHTDEMIDDLVNVAYGDQPGGRERHVYREALRSLVRLAKAEQMYEMKVDVQTLTAPTDAILH